MIALCLQGCGPYFNTYFNAQKAYDRGVKMQETRQERDPEDTLVVTTEERAQFNRAIAKSVKVLELWPEDPEYAPLAVFLMADSYLLMEEYDRAAQKYDEFIRYFPESEKIPLAEIRRARALFHDGQGLRAREALSDILKKDPEGDVRREALLLSARMQIADGSAEDGLALYEQLLEEEAFSTPDSRAEAHWQAALLAYDAEMWERSRRHAIAGNLETMPSRARYRNNKLAIQCLLHLGRHRDAIAETDALYERREFRSVRSDLLVLRGRALEGLGEWNAAEENYRDAARLEPGTAASAEAWYRIASRFLDVENLEDSARVYYDSAAAAGTSHDYGERGSQKLRILKRLNEMRAAEAEEKEEYSRRVEEESGMRTPELEEARDTADTRDVPDFAEEVADVPVDTAAVAADTGGADGVPEPENAKNDAGPSHPHYYPLMIAELFLYDLGKPDSARVHLNRVVGDTLEDSAHTRRALYALAWVEREHFGNKARADSLYREILEHYPDTEWAKQAERHLGRASSVRTNEDKARALFLDAERERFENGSPPSRAVPLYRQVAERYPGTVYAPRAMFTVAHLLESRALAAPGEQPLRDSALAAYREVAERFIGTPYGNMAAAKVGPLEDEAVAGEEGAEAAEGEEEEGERHDTRGERESAAPREEVLEPSPDDEYLY